MRADASCASSVVLQGVPTFIFGVCVLLWLGQAAYVPPPVFGIHIGGRHITNPSPLGPVPDVFPRRWIPPDGGLRPGASRGIGGSIV